MLPYIIAVVFMALVGVAGIVVLMVARPKEDNILVITMILGFLAPTTMSLLALMKAQETHKIVNSELDKWKETMRRLSFAEGELAERTRADRAEGPNQ